MTRCNLEPAGERGSMAVAWRLFWLLVIAGHAVAAVGWWWLSPGGFPISNPHFWANRVVPVVVLTGVVFAVRASSRARFDVLSSTLVAFPTGWAAASIAARIVFPITFASLFWPPLLGAFVMALAIWLTFRRLSDFSVRRTFAVAAVAALIGAALPLCERAADPDTRPLDLPLPVLVADPSPAGRTFDGWSSRRMMVHPGDGSLTVRSESLTIAVQPMLRFLSRSPDRCWTVLAPDALRTGPPVVLESAGRDGGTLAMRYRADAEATLRIDPGSDGDAIKLEACTRLPRPVFSHLNSFCDLVVSGHRRLSLSFSPCPEARIDVRPADYPVGRPMRLAFRDARDRFHVVEATSGEKGPFRELAAGRLARSEPLVITLHDRGIPLARVVFDDWSAQSGTLLSPTAGWGLPVNAIEFSLEGESPGSAAAIYVTLAGTSVGRGWDSVGHAAGIYRNRMEIEVLAADSTHE